MTKLEQILKDLPPDLQQEVEDFAEFVRQKHVAQPEKRLKLDWADACKDLRDQYTSVELQHKISDWMVGKQ